MRRKLLGGLTAAFVAAPLALAGPAQAAPPPGIHLVEPSDETYVTYGDPVNFSATVGDPDAPDPAATDNADRVEFLLNNVVVATDTDGSDGWSATWDSNLGVPLGSYFAEARASNADGVTYTLGPNELHLSDVAAPPPPDPEPEPDPVITAPTCLVGYPYADRTVKLDWDDVPGATSYAVFSDLNTPEPTYITSVTTSERTSGALSSGSYRYYIVATDGTNNSDPSPKVTVTVPGDGTPVSNPAGCNPDGGTTPPPDPDPEPEPQPTGDPALPASGPVTPVAETPSLPVGSGDVADDPAIWVHPTDPSQSVVFGTNKNSPGGLAAYNLDGSQLAWFPENDAYNNVDVRGNVVLVSDRSDNQIEIWAIDPATRAITNPGSIAVGYEPYGLCAYQASDGTVYGFATSRLSPYQIDQFQVNADLLGGSKVRDIDLPGLAEGCVADDESNSLFVGVEDSGIYRASAVATDPTTSVTVDTVGAGNLVADVEGLAVVRGRNGEKNYLLASSQGDSTYQVYDLASPFTHRKEFTVGSTATIDAASSTDGLDATWADLGTAFPNGLVVVHDASNSGGTTSNFKFVDAGDVFGAYGDGGGTTNPPPPTTDLRGPSGSTVIFEDDFESGLDCTTTGGPWRYVGNAEYAGACASAPSSMTRLSFPDGQGEDGAGDRAARFEVRASDVASNGERSEIDTGSAASSNIFHEGDKVWYQGRIKLPSDFTSGPGFYIFTQFHSGIGSPPVSLSLTDGGGLQVGGQCGTLLVPDAAMNAAKGGYVDYSLAIDFSQSSGSGGVDAWAETPDGTVYDPPRTACATLADSESYFKVGIYRNSVYSDTGVIYLDDLRLTQ